MTWRRIRRIPSFRHTSYFCQRLQCFSHSSHRYGIQRVLQLEDWNIDRFRSGAFQPALPAKLPCSPSSLPPACHKWFTHENNPNHDLTTQPLPKSSELDIAFWTQYSTTTIPVELTTTHTSGTKSFSRAAIPFQLFLDHSNSSDQSLYVAQHSLTDLPPSLQSDLPTPTLVSEAGKGDIYSTSLWMGRPPTFTPLHRDPNPNLFMQLAGFKIVRLFEPEIGRAIFTAVSHVASNEAFRGEDMMQGEERKALEWAIWDSDGEVVADAEEEAYQREFKDSMSWTLERGYEARLELGQALFIPKGWWHSVKGVGGGMNASVNWWFR